MNKHTPGPWEVHDYRNGDASAETWIGILKGAFDVDGKARQIGQFRFSALPTEENWANAYLMAAAPDLLAACKAFIDYDEAETSGTNFLSLWKDLKRKIEAAIAKAEGR